MKKRLLLTLCMVVSLGANVNARQTIGYIHLPNEEIFNKRTEISIDEQNPGAVVFTNSEGAVSMYMDDNNYVAKDARTGKVFTKYHENADGSSSVYADTDKVKMDIRTDANNNARGNMIMIEGNYKIEMRVNGQRVETFISEARTNRLICKSVGRLDDEYVYVYDASGKLIAEGYGEDSMKVHNRASFAVCDRAMTEIEEYED